MTELRPIQANAEATEALDDAGLTNYGIRSEVVDWGDGPPMILTRVTVAGGSGEMDAVMRALKTLPGYQDSCFWRDEVRVYRARRPR